MASKLKLQPCPTFKHGIDIPVPGAEAEQVIFEFRTRSRSELEEFAKKIPKYKTDTDMMLDFTVGWNIASEFNSENVTLLLENYPGSGQRVLSGYWDEISKARLGN